ncbi:MAG: transposase [Candidatus Acidiferrales bacterium]
MEAKLYYQRNLPHWHPPGTPLFVTWRLHGSLPRPVLRMLEEKNLSEGRRFALADRELDKASCGPVWLRDAQIAQGMVETLRRGERELRCFELHTFVVMANHVHMLVTPNRAVARIMRGIKRHSAANANQILGRAGQRFWQEESYDHWCRNAVEVRAHSAVHRVESGEGRSGAAATGLGMVER